MKIWKFLVAGAIAVIAASELSAKSGIEVGYMNSIYTTKYDAQKDVQHMSGFYLGYNKDWKLFAGLSLQPGLYYSFTQKSESSTLQFLSTGGQEIEHNLNLPVNIKYTFDILPILKIRIFAGPTFSLGLANGIKANVKVGEAEGKYRMDYYTGKYKVTGVDESNATGQISNEYMLNRFDIMIGGGVGIDIFKFTIKGGYDYGLMNRLKYPPVDGYTFHRSQFYVSLGFNF